MTIGVIGAGHVFEFQYNALKDLGFDLVLCDLYLTKINNYKERITNDYHELLGLVDVVLISTPPSTHKEIIDFFSNNNVDIICEKPLVTKYDDLVLLKNIKNFYNILHYSFGLEISWFINNFSKNNIYKVVAHINDPYIENNRIRDESISLNGSYLDEVINPLSAIYRIFGGNISYVDSKLYYLCDDKYDYHSISNFSVNNIPVIIIVTWNDIGCKDKYIDIYYDNYVIRLDSINQSVINLNDNKVLYKADGIRMYNHYFNGFKDYLIRCENINEAYLLNEVILKGLK